MRPSEAVIALSGVDALLTAAHERIASGLRFVAGDHLLWLLAETEAGAKLEGDARAKFEGAYAAIVRGHLEAVASKAARELRDEATAAGIVDGRWTTPPAFDASGRAAQIAAAAFGRTQGKALEDLAAGVVKPEPPALSSFGRLGRAHVSAVFNRARTAAVEANRGSLRGFVVERSAIQDRETCPACRQLDGFQTEFDTSAYHLTQPPKKCDGGGNCRCIYVLIGKGEGGPA